DDRRDRIANGRVGRQCDDVHAWHHDLVDGRLFEIEHGVDHLALVLFDQAFLFARRDVDAKLLGREQWALGDRTAMTELAGQAVGDAPDQVYRWRKQPRG